MKDYQVLVVGGGPAGLSAAGVLSNYGIKTLLVDEGIKLGGQLVKQTHKFFGSREHWAGVRGVEIPEKILDTIDKDVVDIWSNSTVIGIYPEDGKVYINYNQQKLYGMSFPYIVIATGASENMILFEGNDLPGVFGAGAVQTLMNQYGIIPGHRVLMVGAGNIGLIVSYQLLQAGVKVVKVVEAAPQIGGYLVHASKIVRMGIPIETRTTILRAEGKERVERAVIAKLDDNWKPLAGTEETLEVDTVCLSVGLSASYRLALQAGCETAFVPELGGEIVKRDRWQQTSVKGVYIAGDAACIEEASSAMVEGRIAGLGIVKDLFPDKTEEVEAKWREEVTSLNKLRKGPFGERIKVGVEKLIGGDR